MFKLQFDTDITFLPSHKLYDFKVSDTKMGLDMHEWAKEIQ